MVCLFVRYDRKACSVLLSELSQFVFVCLFVCLFVCVFVCLCVRVYVAILLQYRLREYV